MTMHVGQNNSPDLVELVRLECRAFAARIRMARAVLGWSQHDLASRVGLTQRAIHKLEQGETEPRRATVRAIEAVWHDEGLEFEDLPDGGFRVSIRAPLLDKAVRAPARRHRRDAASITRHSPVYRA
jgi:transcriptional regulator with XRE-family HTH domain